MHELDIIPTLVGGLGAALLFGYVTQRLGLSPIVGYLLAGVVIGPNSPGFTADSAIANQFAEVGVVLLMFGVGLHFDLDELSRVRRIAVPGALIQCSLSVVIGTFMTLMLGWSALAALVFGIAIAFASTVVVTRLLADTNELQTQTGNVAIGWLIVQDLLAVLVLVLLPALAEPGVFSVTGISSIILVAALKMGLVILGITFVGGRIIPNVLRYVAETRSRELFTLTVLVIVLGIALASARLFGVSMALGAFLAGIVVGQSDFSLRAASEALPMRDAFAVLFFVSVGMLFDPIVFFQSSRLLIGTLALVMLATPLISFSVVIVLGYPLKLALRVAFSLAQIGEFSFIVANLARDLELLPIEAMHVLVAASIISISLSPLWQYLVEPITKLCGQSKRLHPLITMRCAFSMRPAAATDSDTSEEINQDFRTVIVGYGPVGKTVAYLLKQNGVTPTIIEMNHSNLATIRQDGYRAVLGDANHLETLKHAGVGSSQSLILSASTIRGASEIIRLARELNPKIKIIVRSAYLRERLPLIQNGADTVFAGEGEVAMALAEYILRDLGATPDQIDRERDKLRSDLFS
ncbi:MAG: cation:proton antiporter [Pirellulaceae bacterium]|nr:cation:proton antiporter [Pirellulaceae bacterium]